MNYTEFMNAMLCEIRGQVDAQVRTELYTVTKNNGTRRTGILFKQEDSNLAPTIYLEEFYQKYLEGAAGTGSGRFHLQYLSGDSGEENL